MRVNAVNIFAHESIKELLKVVIDMAAKQENKEIKLIQEKDYIDISFLEITDKELKLIVESILYIECNTKFNKEKMIEKRECHLFESYFVCETFNGNKKLYIEYREDIDWKYLNFWFDMGVFKDIRTYKPF